MKHTGKRKREEAPLRKEEDVQIAKRQRTCAYVEAPAPAKDSVQTGRGEAYENFTEISNMQSNLMMLGVKRLSLLFF